MDIPVVILAGGLGTRLREETEVRPKPMVEIGGYPILWHIMKTYAAFGCREFVVCLGYKGDFIKDFFLNYRSRQGSVSVDLATGDITSHDTSVREGWKVHLLETGLETMTGGRIRRAAEFLAGRRFMATYGDGVSNVDIAALLALHERNGLDATVTAVRPPARFGGLTLEQNQVLSFEEKPQVGEGWINGGFMVFESGIIDLIEDDTVVLERVPLETLAARRRLGVYRHEGFWQCMDTVRDLQLLRDLWDRRAAPWNVW